MSEPAPAATVVYEQAQQRGVQVRPQLSNDYQPSSSEIDEALRMVGRRAADGQQSADASDQHPPTDQLSWPGKPPETPMTHEGASEEERLRAMRRKLFLSQ